MGLDDCFFKAEKGVVDWLVELGHAEFASNGVEIGKVPLERAEQRVNETLSGVGLAELRVARLSLNDAFFELEDCVPERRVVHILPSPALRAAVSRW